MKTLTQRSLDSLFILVDVKEEKCTIKQTKNEKKLDLSKLIDDPKRTIQFEKFGVGDIEIEGLLERSGFLGYEDCYDLANKVGIDDPSELINDINRFLLLDVSERVERDIYFNEEYKIPDGIVSSNNIKTTRSKKKQRRLKVSKSIYTDKFDKDDVSTLKRLIKQFEGKKNIKGKNANRLVEFICKALWISFGGHKPKPELLDNVKACNFWFKTMVTSFTHEQDILTIRNAINRTVSSLLENKFAKIRNYAKIVETIKDHNK